MPIASIAVIGATDLGCQFAALSLRASFRTILEDNSIAALDRAAAAIEATRTNDESAHAGFDASAVVGGGAPALLVAHSVEDAVRDADLIIETVADELEMKLELFTIFDKFAKPGAIFATTTSSFAVDDLAEMTICPERCVALRIVRAGKTQELHLRPGRFTSPYTLESCREVARRMGLASVEAAKER